VEATYSFGPVVSNGLVTVRHDDGIAATTLTCGGIRPALKTGFSGNGVCRTGKTYSGALQFLPASAIARCGKIQGDDNAKTSHRCSQHPRSSGHQRTRMGEMGMRKPGHRGSGQDLEFRQQGCGCKRRSG
jgi:hypothetical protein